MEKDYNYYVKWQGIWMMVATVSLLAAAFGYLRFPDGLESTPSGLSELVFTLGYIGAIASIGVGISNSRAARRLRP